MPLQEITLALFAACNSIRVVAYVPQILKAATDKNGASSISLMTWGLFGAWRRASRSTHYAALRSWPSACGSAGHALGDPIGRNRPERLHQKMGGRWSPTLRSKVSCDAGAVT
jgi:hypothetical protein